MDLELNEQDYRIRTEWMDHYEILEKLHKSGVVDMYMAVPLLAAIAEISDEEATQVLASFALHYETLKTLHKW